MIDRYFPFTLTLRSPLLVTSLDGDPQSAATLNYIPGSSIRGVVARHLGDPGTDPQRLDEFRSLILAGAIRYLNVYPAVDGRRSLPAPLSLLREKHSGENLLHDTAAFDGRPPDDHDVDDCWPARSVGGAAPTFLTLDAPRLTAVEPHTSARLHQQRDRSKGRAWMEPSPSGEIAHGSIFTFESLDEGQSFMGMVHMRRESEERIEHDIKRVRAALGHRLLLGRSRRAGYGGDAEIKWHEPARREVVGGNSLTEDIGVGDVFRAVLTSHYIGRNSMTGQADPTWLLQEVRDRLGGGLDLVRVRWEFKTVGAFNRKWGLEMPQALAVRAGSVLVLKATRPLQIHKLLEVEHEGVGERTPEGFGRLAFFGEPLREMRFDDVSESPSLGEAPTGHAPSMVAIVEQRIVEVRLRRGIQEVAASIARTAMNIPSSSLIARLRGLLRSPPQRALSDLKDKWLGDGESSLKKPAMSQLDRCRVGAEKERQSLADWLRATAGQGAIGEQLGFDVLAQRGHVISEESVKQQLESHVTIYAVELIDAVLETMAVRKRLEEERHDRD